MRYLEHNRGQIPDVAVQVVNYRTKTCLEHCLKTLLDDTQHGPNCHVHVADNASGDDLSDLERRFGKEVAFHYFPHNVGYGVANNILTQMSDESGSPAILMLNPDVIFTQPETVKKLFDRLDEFPDVKVVGPQLINSKGERQIWDHADYPFKIKVGPKEFHPYMIPLAPWYRDTKLTSVPWVSGAVFMVERAAFRKSGGFDPNFFLYFEEQDLCMRLIKAGGTVLYDPTIVVTHIGSSSTADIKEKRDLFIQSFSYFVDKYHPKFVAVLMKFIYRRAPQNRF